MEAKINYKYLQETTENKQEMQKEWLHSFVREGRLNGDDWDLSVIVPF